MYKIALSPKADRDIQRFQNKEPDIYRKVQKLFGELMKHPRTGTGKPKQLTGSLSGYFSRRITGKHRLVYKIEDEIISVFILSVKGHYFDR